VDVIVRVRLTRAQIVALNPCSEGMACFDRLVPSGIFVAESEAESMALDSRAQPAWLDWIGNVKPRRDGSGSGDGYGSGYGSGDGSGDGVKFEAVI
jgi:hypothetical protein